MHAPACAATTRRSPSAPTGLPSRWWRPARARPQSRTGGRQRPGRCERTDPHDRVHRHPRPRPSRRPRHVRNRLGRPIRRRDAYAKRRPKAPATWQQLQAEIEDIPTKLGHGSHVGITGSMRLAPAFTVGTALRMVTNTDVAVMQRGTPWTSDAPTTRRSCRLSPSISWDKATTLPSPSRWPRQSRTTFRRSWRPDVPP